MFACLSCLPIHPDMTGSTVSRSECIYAMMSARRSIAISSFSSSQISSRRGAVYSQLDVVVTAHVCPRHRQVFEDLGWTGQQPRGTTAFAGRMRSHIHISRRTGRNCIINFFVVCDMIVSKIFHADAVDARRWGCQHVVQRCNGSGSGM